MNLSLYPDDYYFVTHSFIAKANDGADELFLSGSVTPYIPEPSTLGLFVLGVVGVGLVGIAGRKK